MNNIIYDMFFNVGINSKNLSTETQIIIIFAAILLSVGIGTILYLFISKKKKINK